MADLAENARRKAQGKKPAVISPLALEAVRRIDEPLWATGFGGSARFVRAGRGCGGVASAGRLIVVSAFETPGFDDVAMGGQAVEQRSRYLGIAEHGRVPLFLNGSCLTSRSLTRIISYLGTGLRC
jgi:hypothetical protein